MVSKKQLLLQSIRELLALSVSDREIIMNLREVGIDSAEAKQLIAEARNPAISGTKEDITSNFLERTGGLGAGAVRRKRTFEESESGQKEAAAEEAVEEKLEDEKPDSLEEMASELSEEEPAPWAEEKEEEPAAEPEEKEEEPIEETEEEAKKEKPLKGFFGESEPEEKPRRATGFFGESTPEEKPEAKSGRLVEDITVSSLWEKGILGTVNQRLAEMKKLKEEIDSVLDKKVADATKRDIDKIKVLFDSQRSLLVSKVDTEIESKAKSFADMIELKLREMRDISRQISGQTERLKEERDKSRLEVEKISAKLKEVDRVKEELLSSLNSEVIKIKAQSKQFLQEMNQKASEMDGRINKTLQLENQVVEGLVKGAEQKIQETVAGTLEDFEKNTKRILQEFKKTKDSFDSEQSGKITEMQSQFNIRMAALDSQIKERLAKLDELQKTITVEITPEKFKEQMKELNEFKAQFVEAIKQNAERFNEGIRKMNEENQRIEKQFNMRAEIIDKKIAELDSFEKNFSKEMGLTLEKMKKAPAKK